MSDTTNVSASAQQQGDPDALGDAGKKALDAERAARAQAEKESADLKARIDELEAEKLSDIEKATLAAETATARVAELEAELAGRDLTIMRQRVAAELKLPAELADRIQGDSEDALRDDAKKLAALVPDNNQSTFPKPDPSQGVQGNGTGGTTAEAFANAVKNIL